MQYIEYIKESCLCLCCTLIRSLKDACQRSQTGLYIRPSDSSSLLPPAFHPQNPANPNRNPDVDLPTCDPSTIPIVSLNILLNVLREIRVVIDQGIIKQTPFSRRFT